MFIVTDSFIPPYLTFTGSGHTWHKCREENKNKTNSHAVQQLNYEPWPRHLYHFEQIHLVWSSKFGIHSPGALLKIRWVYIVTMRSMHRQWMMMFKCSFEIAVFSMVSRVLLNNFTDSSVDVLQEGHATKHRSASDSRVSGSNGVNSV